MRKAIYPGSFDPITNGHVDIVHRALNLFEEVTIAIFKNPQKDPFFSVEERLSLTSEVFKDTPNLKVTAFSGLVTEFAEQSNIFTIIRGLRAVSDFDYEFQMALTNRRLNAKIETLFLMTDATYAYLSSSLVKQLARFNGDVSPFVPQKIEKALKNKFK